MSRDKTGPTNPRAQRSQPYDQSAADSVWQCVDVLRTHLDADVPLEQVRMAAVLTMMEITGGDSLLAVGVAAQALVELARTGAPKP